MTKPPNDFYHHATMLMLDAIMDDDTYAADYEEEDHMAQISQYTECVRALGGARDAG